MSVCERSSEAPTAGLLVSCKLRARCGPGSWPGSVKVSWQRETVSQQQPLTVGARETRCTLLRSPHTHTHTVVSPTYILHRQDCTNCTNENNIKKPWIHQYLHTLQKCQHLNYYIMISAPWMLLSFICLRKYKIWTSGISLNSNIFNYFTFFWPYSNQRSGKLFHGFLGSRMTQVAPPAPPHTVWVCSCWNVTVECQSWAAADAKSRDFWSQ